MRLNPSRSPRSSHDIDFRLRGCRRGCAALRCVWLYDEGRRDRQGRARSSSASRARSAASMRRCCAPRWNSDFGASDADGGWNWKTAYDACEAATVLFLRKFGPAMRARAAFAGRDAADAGKDRRPSSHPHPPFGRERSASAILDADRAWLRGEHCGRDHAGRHCAGAFGRYGFARHPRRAVRRIARSQRTRRNPRRTSFIFSFPASP